MRPRDGIDHLYKSPLSRGREFRTVAVWAKTDLTDRRKIEDWTVTALRESRVDAIASLEVWPIDASEDEIQTKLKANGIGAVLVLSLDAVARVQGGATSTRTLFGQAGGEFDDHRPRQGRRLVFRDTL